MTMRFTSIPAILWVVALALPTSAAWSAAPRIGIDGLDTEQERNARAHLSLSKLKCSTPEWRLKAMLEKGPKEIRRALQALGHYQVSVQGGKLQRGGGCWSVAFTVDPGKPVVIAEVDIRLVGEAADDKAFSRLLERQPLKQGTALHHGDYETTKKALLSLAASRGYFDAELSDKRLLVKPESQQAWVHLTLDSGPRYRVGQIRYDARELDDELVTRFFTLSPGEPYHQEKLQRLQQSLTGSRYFEKVLVQPRPDKASKAVDLVVDLSARKRHRYALGIGAATDTGPRARATYENRRLNSRGHRFEAEGQVSAIGGRLGASYAIPLDNPTQEWLTFSGGYEREETDSSKRDTFRIGGKFTQVLTDGWLQTAYLDLSHESFEVAGSNGHATPLTPGISWQHIRKDNPQRIRQGHRLDLEVLGAPIDFSEGSTFLQSKASGTLIASPLEQGRLILHGGLGATWAEQQQRMPVSRRFFAGGDNSLRGYEYQSLGPKNAAGEVEGGAYLLVGSLEYEQFINPEWSLAAFVDSGNAFNDKLDTLYTGVGVGVRWQSPVGPVKLDVAHPLDGQDDFRLHIGIGPEF
ncbi:MAG: autotransporter assembly complex protein TamA [Gammaproteobacteria bacterium]|nr:autotransporter assembly complex protein TamA [Gammaproteobacteria bacterium]MBU1653864.1 autotransporter assembly complex protein TamA [Gammaproteobacteria bacterium]MBU1960409.1 autotransporter assembly complex protein TamA [Gammaproteobacteria bacterium]